MHYRMFRSIPGLSVVTSVVTSKNVSRHCQTSLGVGGWGGTGGSDVVELPSVENHCLRGRRPRVLLG